MMISPDLTEAERRMLAALRDLPEAAINVSDVPEAPIENLARARRPNLFRPVKRSVTIRLDADVIEWFQLRSGGRGYQTEINTALRETMEKGRRG